MDTGHSYPFVDRPRQMVTVSVLVGALTRCAMMEAVYQMSMSLTRRNISIAMSMVMMVENDVHITIFRDIYVFKE